jgi:hypothetical protein
MATLGSPVEGFGKGKGWEEQRKNDDARFAELQEVAAKIGPDAPNVTGAIISFQVADGSAIYVVEQKGTSIVLHHVPQGDGYTVNTATIRGIRLPDVRAQVARAQAFNAIFRKTDTFYGRLKVGQILHYDNSFNQYVRCIVEDGVNKDGERGMLLVPIALVGDWKSHDLPKRQPNGSINWGYHVEGIRECRGWQPNEGSIYEARTRRPNDKDPRNMMPLDLTVPAMTPEQERIAIGVSAIEKVHGMHLSEVTESAVATTLDQIIALATEARAQLKK